jgi:Zn-dependent M16 (insulinase) family peptidase
VPHSVGDKLHGFTVKRVTPVPEMHLTTVELEHDVTKASYLHVARAGMAT